MKEITLGGKTYKLLNEVGQGKIVPSEREQITALLSSLEEGEISPDIRSLPEKVILDGMEFITDSIRKDYAVALGESSSWVSDQEVLHVIQGRLENRLRDITILNVSDTKMWEQLRTRVRELLADGRPKQEGEALQKKYIGKRGLMVVDVIASAARGYKVHVEGRIIPKYKEYTEDLSLAFLQNNAPRIAGLREGEAETMSELAQLIMTFSRRAISLETWDEEENEEETVKRFAGASSKPVVRARALRIRGVGGVLYEYLRLLCGCDTIKIDSRVRSALRALGFPQESYSDLGLLEICSALATEVGCSLVDLDQALWLADFD